MPQLSPHYLFFLTLTVYLLYSIFFLYAQNSARMTTNNKPSHLLKIQNLLYK